MASFISTNLSSKRPSRITDFAFLQEIGINIFTKTFNKIKGEEHTAQSGR
jgi:hypothetical protein